MMCCVKQEGSILDYIGWEETSPQGGKVCRKKNSKSRAMFCCWMKDVQEVIQCHEALALQLLSGRLWKIMGSLKYVPSNYFYTAHLPICRTLLTWKIEEKKSKKCISGTGMTRENGFAFGENVSLLFKCSFVDFLQFFITMFSQATTVAWLVNYFRSIFFFSNFWPEFTKGNFLNTGPSYPKPGNPCMTSPFL